MQTNNDDLTEQHDINVTPFIDVMLVLLIIFMVAAPLATVSIPVDLPTSSASSKPEPDEPFYLTIEADMSLTLNETARTTLAQLPDALKQQLPSEQRIYLRADRSITYDQLMQVVNTLGKAGYLQIALVGLEQAEAN